MRMNVFEMEGFLRGKCVPRDLKVNETNAEYLVRKFAEAEAKISALAAENELARKAVQAFCDVVGDNTEVIAEEVGRDGVLVILEAMKATGNMPATDAFLAEVRAQGVEMLAKNHQSIVNALKGDSLFSDGEYRHAIIASAATSFAAELRKGGNQ
ncbi:ead/Ea22-like family protein [Escherichia coli]|nr:ead/Ea22-like family protein [Escherichia coli]EJQ6187402.1 ead/Ea22-like family protein [Escherichia coli]